MPTVEYAISTPHPSIPVRKTRDLEHAASIFALHAALLQPTDYNWLDVADATLDLMSGATPGTMVEAGIVTLESYEVTV